MTAPRPTIDRLAHEALELDSPDAREAYLDVACAGDTELLAAVEQRLAALEAEQRTIDPGQAPAPAFEPGSLGLLKGDRIGRYRLIEILGHGGFGVVWRAEQTEPVRREVALKVIKPGMDSQQVLARFEAERQALAVMDHPCVAKVFDAGVTSAEMGSRPYFVMELVLGVPITDHCDRQRLTIDERLNLFIRACEAVQHAHQKGIIHRDIKPSNILVSVRDGQAAPKVIDFGVAKALHQKLTEQTLFTEQGQLVGTPEYMSPEQAEMTAQDIDTRSDIYSLGVLLYELLTGALPFDPKSLREAAFAEIQRIIREQEPAKPSTRLSSLGGDSAITAKRRRADPRTLERDLRGDLDWIVMKAIEKDRTRRYDAATSLAEDVRRHLNDEPVLAGPPSGVYQLRKLVQKHRVAVASGLLLCALVTSVCAVAMGAQRAAIRSQSDDTDAFGRASFYLGYALAPLDSIVHEPPLSLEQAREHRGVRWAIQTSLDVTAFTARFDSAILDKSDDEMIVSLFSPHDLDWSQKVDTSIMQSWTVHDWETGAYRARERVMRTLNWAISDTHGNWPVGDPDYRAHGWTPRRLYPRQGPQVLNQLGEGFGLSHRFEALEGVGFVPADLYWEAVGSDAKASEDFERQFGLPDVVAALRLRVAAEDRVYPTTELAWIQRWWVLLVLPALAALLQALAFLFLAPLIRVAAWCATGVATAALVYHLTKIGVYADRLGHAWLWLLVSGPLAVLLALSFLAATARARWLLICSLLAGLAAVGLRHMMVFRWGWSFPHFPEWFQ